MLRICKQGTIVTWSGIHGDLVGRICKLTRKENGTLRITITSDIRQGFSDGTFCGFKTPPPYLRKRYSDGKIFRKIENYFDVFI